MIKNYKKFLEFIEQKLEGFFENQKDYIFCKKGCAKCCKNAQFPYSLIEVTYLLQGALELDEALQEKIKANILTLKEKYKNCSEGAFLYDCPFLIDDVCSVYNYRGIVCRTFGLITKNPLSDSEKLKIPFCHKIGLNYSNVTDVEHCEITPEKYLQSGIKEEPYGYNISYEFLTNSDFERGFNFKFGEKKALVEWLKDFK